LPGCGSLQPSKGQAMTKSGIDQDALIEMFSQASAKQGEALR
jgi:hypothetical protein